MNNPKVDAYIENAQEFAQPILNHWRKLIHKNCPEIEETVKWGYPHFEYRGEVLAIIMGYKNHCTFMFFKAEIMQDERLKNNKNLKPAERFLGNIKQLSDLPSEEDFTALLHEAMILNEKGIKISKQKSEVKKLETPDYFLEALAKNPRAEEIFNSKSDSFRKEYITWIVEAKTETTRQKRLLEAVDWISEGKHRNWKYMK